MKILKWKEVLLMNNKGQTLIIFVLILPVLLLFIAFFIDLSIVSLNKNKINNAIKDNLEVILAKEIRDSDKIENIFLENNILIDEIIINDQEIKIVAKYQIDSLFGNILKLNMYKINKTYIGYYADKKIIGEL